ncbi:sensor histidine kinase [Arthrobacter cavernae]|uniref:sensor histidine kinase n=1 Tax=Arthrobacter cavernae TaxID=2817681 RepID=UPI0027DB6462|nr:ATP-binding protein [Arthrobacter cavernae]
MAIPVAFWIRAEAERHALDNAKIITQGLADYAISPLMTEQLLARDPAALTQLDRLLQPWFDGGVVTRIKVWDAQGRVVYSDVDSLIGQTFDQPESARELLAGGPATATLESQNELENAFEETSGELLEVYVRSTAQSGTPLIFEAYYDGTGVRQEQEAVLYGMIPPLLLALAVLQLAQLIPAARLAHRIQAFQATRHSLLRHAVEASDLERRRIARELHDDVIQDLSGLAYALESEERQGPEMQRPLFANARTILQENVRTLRAMTSELYPPDLQEVGLEASLLRLGTPLLERGISLTVDVPDKFVLDRERAVMVYRVAREALANVAKHSSAQLAELRIRQNGHRTEIRISDDGLGFDPSRPPLEGHLGLRILRDTIDQAGGSLEIQSAPGSGTTVTATFVNAAVPTP